MKRGAFALAAIALVTGCLGSGGDDLSIVCERRASGPWSPYPPDDLAAFASFEGNATDAQKRALLQAAADAIATPQGAPFGDFAIVFRSPGGGASWVVHAEGVAPDAQYDFAIELTDAGGTVSGLNAPDTLVAAARVAVNASSVRWVEDDRAPQGGAWTRARPSCVELRYGEDALTLVTVNVAQGRVVNLVNETAS